MVASELTVRRRFSALHILCLWFTLFNGGAARVLRSPYQPSLEIAEVIHRKLQTSSYCVAISNADSKKLQAALDWACGSGSTLGNVDCSAIQQGGSCYQPNSMTSHASYAFDVYYAKQNGASGACNFGGLATTTQTNPSSGTCVYPSPGSSSTTPTTPTTPTTTPTTPTTPTPSSSTPTLSPPTNSNYTAYGGSPLTSTGGSSSGTTSAAIAPVSVPGMHTFIVLIAVAAYLSSSPY